MYEKFSFCWCVGFMMASVALKPLPAYALEKLSFVPTPPAIITKIPTSDNRLMARADLNGDGLKEYIFSDDNKDGLHDFEIYAYEDEAVLLGQFSAFKIMLSDSVRHGVRSLYVYNNPNNDYAYQVYEWHAEQSRYSLIAGLSQQGGAP